jgi:hypothetical protein
MRYDDREKPALVTVMNLLGWLAIFVAIGLAVVRSGYYQPPLPAPRVAWAEIISTAFGGILLFCFAGIIRVLHRTIQVLHRIEQAIGETRAALLTGLSVKVKTAPQTKESI